MMQYWVDLLDVLEGGGNLPIAEAYMAGGGRSSTVSENPTRTTSVFPI